MSSTDSDAGLEPEVRKIRGAVRTSAAFGVRHALRRWWTLRAAGEAGAGIHVDRNVRLLRHPGRVSLGGGSMLKEGVRLCPAQPDAHIRIGDRTTVGYHTFMFASARITIGSDCLIAPFCYLVDADHGIAAGRLIQEQDLTASPITIGDDVWLGVGVKVLSGVRIGSGAVVAAGAVVKEDIPENAIAAGTPARVKRYRT